MTLGCGGYGGNITSDNISPRHLLNIKRLAYEVAPVVSRWDRPFDSAQGRPGGRSAQSITLPSAPSRPAAVGISAEALNRQIDAFLGGRGYRPGLSAVEGLEVGVRSDKSASGQTSRTAAGEAPPLDFVCEEDVRQAIQAGRKLLVSERAIVTPAARDLGEEHRVFSYSSWRG
jgi:hypothetical protein